MRGEAHKANAVSDQPRLQPTEFTKKRHAAATVHVKSQSPVCERTCGVLGKGGWEETDWRSAGGEDTAAEPICSVVERRSQHWHVTRP